MSTLFYDMTDTASAAPSTLSGKVAIVTGGSRGIGNAIALELVAEGVDVLLCSRSAGGRPAGVGDPAGTDASARVGRIETSSTNVQDALEVEALVARAVHRFGRLDILVNNAGIGRFCSLAETRVEEWREVIGTNLDGAFYACRAAIPELRKQGGWIVNVSSLAGSHPFSGGAAYCASKAGLDALSEVLMQEVRHDDIRVTCVAPGSVGTGFAGQAAESPPSWKLTPSDVARVVMDMLHHHPRSLPSRVEIRPSRPAA